MYPRSTLATALLCLTVPAHAADVATLPHVNVVATAIDPDDARPGTVSTATRTALPPRDIPQTIDTVDVAKSRDYGINDLGTMLEGVPGVTVTPDARANEIDIRGFSASYGDIYIDGIRSSGQIVRGTANIERVEVLKGPASVLYGRGNGGGMINMISKQANFQSRSSVGLRGGSWDTVGGTVDLNRVVSPNVAVRLTADAENAHSFRHGIQSRNRMVSPSILYDNQAGLTWLMQYTFEELWRVPDRPTSRETLPADVPIRNAFAHPDDYMNDTQHYARSDMRYQLNPDWAVRWVVGHRNSTQDFDHLYAGTYRPATGLITGRMRAWQETENITTSTQLDLTGKATTFGLQHDLLFGLEAAREKRLPRLATISGEAPSINPYDPIVWYPKTPWGRPTQHNDHRARSIAFAAQDLITFSPQWKALLGVRVERYRFQSTNLLTSASRSYDDTSINPRAGLIWNPLPDHSVYVSYSKSFAPYGGRGLVSVDTSPTAIYDDEPQRNRQLEVGVKSDWLNGRLSTQLALYDLSRYNIRVQDVDDPTIYHVVGLERTRGIELSGAGRIVGNWYVRGGFAFQNPKVEEDHRPGRAGLYKVNVARKNGNLFLRYAPPSGVFAETGVTYVGSRQIDALNTQQLDGYLRWDALVGWRNGDWTVTGSVVNVADREYWRSTSLPGAPRTFLLSGRYEF